MKPQQMARAPPPSRAPNLRRRALRVGDRHDPVPMGNAMQPLHSTSLAP